MQKRLALFIDTNLAQTFIGDVVFLSTVGIPETYYALLSFIKKNHLEAQVEICFPEVVVREMKKHMLSSFSKMMDDLEKNVTKYKKLFGDLIHINYEISIESSHYTQYVETLFEEFFENAQNMCKIIQCPQGTELVDTLLEKAIQGIRPFVVSGVNGKKYKDAGFKDSLIAETIYAYCQTNDCIGVLISKDGDYNEVFDKKLTSHSAYAVLPSFEKAIETLEEYFGTNPIQKLRASFEQERYWHERILSEAELLLDESVTSISVQDIEAAGDGTYYVQMEFIVNEAEYTFTIHFDEGANEIIEVNYKISND